MALERIKSLLDKAAEDNRHIPLVIQELFAELAAIVDLRTAPKPIPEQIVWEPPPPDTPAAPPVLVAAPPVYIDPPQA